MTAYEAKEETEIILRLLIPIFLTFKVFDFPRFSAIN